MTEKPAREAAVKRGSAAADCFAYCGEAGRDVWGVLTRMKSLSGEPVCLWLPQRYRKPGTSKYLQGVVVAADYGGPVPDGFDVIDLPPQPIGCSRANPRQAGLYRAPCGKKA